MKEVHGVYFGKNAIFLSKKDESSTSVKVTDNGQEYKKGRIAKWGEDNRFPQKFLDKLKLNGTANGGLELLKTVHYGGGLAFYKNELSEKGERKKVIQYLEDYPEVKQFFKTNKIPRFLKETISDEETWHIAFPEFVVSKDFKKIIYTRRQDAAWCRREIMNSKTGFSEHVFIKSNWEDDNTKDADKVPSVNNYWSAEMIREYCKSKGILKFIMPIHYVMTDTYYYPKPNWHASYYNGWMDVSNSIPKYKKALFENQINLKFIIYISEEYFKSEYEDDWEDYDTEKKQKIKTDLIDAIDDHLSGNEASGRSMYSKKFKTADGDWVKGIEVEAIDNKIKDGSFLPDGYAANGEVLFPMKVDPSIIGSGLPGGKMGSGSGSDKRVAYDILSSLFGTKRETSLEIINFIKDFNGWDDDLYATFETTILQTLDENPTGKKTGL